MAVNYTEEQLNSVDKSFLIQLLLQQQEQLEAITKELHASNEKIQLLMEQVILGKQNRFGRSSEKMEDTSQICFREIDGTIIFFNEAEAICDLNAAEPEDLELKSPKQPKRKGKKEADLSGLPVRRIDHYLSEEELEAEFGVRGWKQLPDAISRKYHPREFLKGYDGICVTDGYQVYHTLEKELEELTIAGCWVHCRRRFDEALKLISKSYQKESNAFLLMKQIQAIYREEGKLKDLSSDERLKQRQAVIKPLVDAFFAYLKTINVSKKDKFGDAVGYALNQEKYLRVFLTDGDVPIDNNASERAIRGFCIGKKNWQMIDTIHGAKSSAIIYSIVETAKANNLKPFDYVQHLLEEMPKHMDDRDCSFLENLLPWSEKLPAGIRKA